MKKPPWEDDLDTFDREAIAYAQALTKFGADIESMYRIGVELNYPAPQFRVHRARRITTRSHW